MNKDLKIIAGYSFSQPYQVVGIDETNTEYPFDISDATITAMAKPTATSCKSYEFTVTITDGPNGKFVLSMDSELTDTITEQSLVYDVKLDNTFGFVFRIAYGSISIEREITP